MGSQIVRHKEQLSITKAPRFLSYKRKASPNLFRPAFGFSVVQLNLILTNTSGLQKQKVSIFLDPLGAGLS